MEGTIQKLATLGMQVDTGPRQTQKMQKMKKMSNIDPSKKKTGYVIRGLLALSVKVLKWS